MLAVPDVPLPSDMDSLAGVDGILQQCIRYFQQLTALSQLEELSIARTSV